MIPTFNLPVGTTVFERGWLSSNNILLAGRETTALIDSGYATHSVQTIALLRHALHGRPLDRLINSHLHSDHCGGNAAVQQAYPRVQTLIPPGQAASVRDWDPVALGYLPTGQTCPRFSFDELLRPGETLPLGDVEWEVHASPGHDPHSVIFFEPRSRTLISADALWQSGFGVVFPELEGCHAFAAVADTLDLIESLDPLLIVPGHGPVFSELAPALEMARRRLDNFVRSPDKHARHAAKVLLKFRLLDVQATAWPELLHWAQDTEYFGLMHRRHFGTAEVQAWLRELVEELVRSGALRQQGNVIKNV